MKKLFLIALTVANSAFASDVYISTWNDGVYTSDYVYGSSQVYAGVTSESPSEYSEDAGSSHDADDYGRKDNVYKDSCDTRMTVSKGVCFTGLAMTAMLSVASSAVPGPMTTYAVATYQNGEKNYRLRQEQMKARNLKKIRVVALEKATELNKMVELYLNDSEANASLSTRISAESTQMQKNLQQLFPTNNASWKFKDSIKAAGLDHSELTLEEEAMVLKIAIQVFIEENAK